MMRTALALALATAVTFPALAVDTSPRISADEASAIAADAYVYFYPMITMDVTRKQLTNMPEGSGIGGPMNQFVNVRTFPPADMKAVVRPNFDTLYSSAWLDLTKEPLVLSVPDTDGRYFLLPMLDMWTDVFASPGWRTTGTEAGHFLIAPTDWRPELRDGFDEYKLPEGTTRLDAPTPHVWIIGRTKTDGPADYAAVNKIQDGFKLTPLSEWGKDYKAPAYQPDPKVDVKTPPKTTVDTMPGDAYFAYAAELLKTNPPHLTDQPMIARLERLGFKVGEDFDAAALDPVVKDAIAAAPGAGQALMKWKLPTLARIENGWSMNTDTMGVYGNYYLKRAIVAQQGLGANVPEDAIYPLNLADSTGQPLHGAHAYTLHFEKADLPPVDAFWSVTLYDQDGFQVANPLNRFAVSSWMPFVYNADGSLDLYFQNASPGKDHEANWLPAPTGPFNLTMRLYAPHSAALTGKWNPPAVVKTVPSGLAAQ
jgi:hypothetical protein